MTRSDVHLFLIATVYDQRNPAGPAVDTQRLKLQYQPLGKHAVQFAKHNHRRLKYTLLHTCTVRIKIYGSDITAYECHIKRRQATIHGFHAYRAVRTAFQKSSPYLNVAPPLPPRRRHPACQ